METVLWPFAVYFGAVLIIVTGMVAISSVLGERHSEPTTADAYESGVVTTGSARSRLTVKFYLVALFFVIFDVESIFIFAWAIAFRNVGWVAYLEVLFFIGVLIAAWIYLWRLGALDWGTILLEKQSERANSERRKRDEGGTGGERAPASRAEL